MPLNESLNHSWCAHLPDGGFARQCRSGALPWWQADGHAWQRRVDAPETVAADSPIGVGGDDLVSSAGDEVPPHEHGLVERHASDEQRPGRRVHSEDDLVAADTEIREVTGLDENAVGA